MCVCMCVLCSFNRLSSVYNMKAFNRLSSVYSMKAFNRLSSVYNMKALGPSQSSSVYSMKAFNTNTSNRLRVQIHTVDWGKLDGVIYAISCGTLPLVRVYFEIMSPCILMVCSHSFESHLNSFLLQGSYAECTASCLFRYSSRHSWLPSSFMCKH